MGIDINISQCSRELIKKYKVASGMLSQLEVPDILDLTALLHWLDDNSELASKPQSQAQQDILFSLRVELLHDLCLILNGKNPKQKQAVNGLSHAEKIKFILLTAGGLLVAACEGFDSVVTMLGLLTLPSTLILTCGVIFSCMSMIAFCGIGIIKLSNSLGVKINQTRKILDESVRQLNEITLIREKLASHILASLSDKELKDIESIVGVLEQRLKQLVKRSEQFNQVLHDGQMQGVQLVLSGIASMFIFGGAFCAGQTTSFNILSLFLTAVTPASAPVVLCSFLVGLSAFGIYWALEDTGTTTLIGSWFGWQTAEIGIMCDKDKMDAEVNALDVLKTNVQSTRQLKEQISTDNSTRSGYSIYRFMPQHPSLIEERRGTFDGLLLAAHQDSNITLSESHS